MMRVSNSKTAWSVVAVAIFSLTGCSDAARDEGGRSKPDVTADSEQVSSLQPPDRGTAQDEPTDANREEKATKETPRVKLVYGGESPSALMERIVIAIDEKDRDTLIACAHPQSARDKQRQEAELFADSLVAAVEAQEFLKKGSEKFGKEQFSGVIREAGFGLFALAAGPDVFRHALDSASVEVEGSKAKFPQAIEVHKRDDDRWYFFSGAGKDSGDAEELEIVIQFVRQAIPVLNEADTIDEFKQKIAPHLAKIPSSVRGNPMATSSQSSGEADRSQPGPAQVQSSEPEIDATSTQESRKALEWVLSLEDSQVMVMVKSGRNFVTQFVDRKEDIPTDDFWVQNLNIFSWEVTDEELKNLEAFADIEGLSFGGPKLTDDGLKHVAGMKKLRDLAVSGSSQVGDAGLEHLRGLTNLVSLALYNTKVTGATFEVLAGMANLQTLHLSDTPTTDDGLKHLAALNGLESLNLARTKITDAGMVHLRGLTELRVLGLGNNEQLTDRAMEPLREMTKMTSLDLGHTSVTDAGLVHLKNMTQLESLTLEGTSVADNGLEHLTATPGLLWLSLQNTQISDAGLEYLSHMKKLDGLVLSSTKVTSSGLKHLAGLKSLTSLNLAFTQVTDVGLEHLGSLSNLEILSLVGTEVTSDGVKRLRDALPKCDVAR
jgi:Leucine-rich repeat (LRR) protein